MKHFIQTFLFPLLLILLTCVICLANYTPYTWLTGWDTLHPEFDFGLNFKRLLFGVWRADQGLGAVAAHSHMSELPRLALLWLFSLVFDQSVLRYLYVFLCFILGPLGVYFFLKKAIFTQKTLASGMGAFLGALFYIFNLATVQQFFIPFEMFMTQYAVLGWLFMLATVYLYHRQKRYLLFFALVSFAAAPMAYASLLWYAYFLGLLAYLAAIVLIEKKKILVKGSVLILLTVFATNAFWLLPNIYFLRNHAAEVPLASTNILFSEEAFLHNKQYGNLKDAIVFKSFLFNWDEQKGPGLITSHRMLEEWSRHLANPFVSAIGYIAFLFVIGGVIVSFLQRRTVKIALLPAGVIALVMIINMNPPFSYLFDFIRDHVSLFKEGLRFPWTKFSFLLVFVSSIYFGIFWQWFFIKIKSIFKFVPFVLMVFLLLWYGLPMFQGQLIDKQLRIAIPHEYFDLFQWINKQPEIGRVAPLPMHSPWGWEYYDWGYQGSGFLWFGIRQPLLARDFDRWNSTNEQYYREMGTALYARDVSRVEALADAYQIRYFILDESVIFPQNKPNALWFAQTEDIFSRSIRFHRVKQFGKNIRVYTFDLNNNVRSYMQAPSSFAKIAPQLTGGYQDQAVQDYPNYITSNNPTVVYPFRNMVNRYGRLTPQSLTVTDTTAQINLGKLPKGQLGEKWTDNTIFPSFIGSDELSVEKQAQLEQNRQELFVSFPLTRKPVYLKDFQKEPKQCGTEGNDSGGRTVIDDYVSFLAESDDTSCDYLTFLTSQDLGYLLLVESRNDEGLPIRFCISSHVTRRCDTYTQLTESTQWTKEIFVIPPYPTGPSPSAGFDIHFNTVSIGNITSRNDVRTVQLIAFPYYRLENLSFISEAGPYQENGVWVSDDREQSLFAYAGSLNTYGESSPHGLFILNQAYEDGWHAYVMTNSFPFVRPLSEHLMFDNWANAWILPESGDQHSPVKVQILFLPQLLEYLGFVLLLVPFAYVFFHKKRNN